MVPSSELRHPSGLVRSAMCIAIVVSAAFLVPRANAHDTSYFHNNNFNANCPGSVGGYDCTRSSFSTSDGDSDHYTSGLNEWRPGEFGESPIRNWALGYNQLFGGAYFSDVNITANGFLSFFDANDSYNFYEQDYPDLPSGGAPHVGVALLGADLFVGESIFTYGGTDQHGSIWYGVRDDTPDSVDTRFIYYLDGAEHYWTTGLGHCNHANYAANSLVAFWEDGGKIDMQIVDTATDCIFWAPLVGWSGDEEVAVGFEVSAAIGGEYWRQNSWIDESDHNDPWCLPWPLDDTCFDDWHDGYHHYAIRDQQLELLPPNAVPCSILQPEDDNFKCVSTTFAPESSAGAETPNEAESDDGYYAVDLNGWGSGHACENDTRTWAAFIGADAGETLHVNMNGWVSLNDDAAGADRYTPELADDSDEPNSFIAGAWDDLNPGGTAGDNIWHKCTADGGGWRTLTMGWDAVERFGGGNPVTFQIQLIEQTGNFEIHWTSTTNDGGNPTTSSWQDENGDGEIIFRTNAVPYSNVAVELQNKLINCGYTPEIVVPAGVTQHVYCDVVTDSIVVPASSTLHIHSGFSVRARYVDTEPRVVSGTVIIDEAASFKSDDQFRWEDCDEPYETWMDNNDTDRFWFDGKFEVHGNLWVDACPSDWQAEYMFYWDGEIELHDGGLVRSVDSQTDTNQNNGLLWMKSNASLEALAGGTLNLGAWWVNSGSTVINGGNAGFVWKELQILDGGVLTIADGSTLAVSDGFTVVNDGAVLTANGTFDINGVADYNGNTLFVGCDEAGYVCSAGDAYRSLHVLGDGYVDVSATGALNGEYGLVINDGTMFSRGDTDFGSVFAEYPPLIDIENDGTLRIWSGTFDAASAEADVTLTDGDFDMFAGTHTLQGALSIAAGQELDGTNTGVVTLTVAEQITLDGSIGMINDSVTTASDLVMSEDALYIHSGGSFGANNVQMTTGSEFEKTLGTIAVTGEFRIDCGASTQTGEALITATGALGEVTVGSGTASACRTNMTLDTGTLTADWMRFQNRSLLEIQGGTLTTTAHNAGDGILVSNYSRGLIEDGTILVQAGDFRTSGAGLYPGGKENFEMKDGTLTLVGSSSDFVVEGLAQGVMDGGVLTLTDADGGVVTSNSAQLDVNDPAQIHGIDVLRVRHNSVVDLDNNTARIPGSPDFSFNNIDIEGTLVVRREADLLGTGTFHTYDAMGGGVDPGVITLQDDATLYSAGFIANYGGVVVLDNDSALNVSGAMSNLGASTLTVNNSSDVDVSGTANNTGTILINNSSTFDAGATTTSGTFTYDSNADSTVASLANSGSFRKDRNSVLAASGGFTNSAGTSDLADGTLRTTTGAVQVSGGTVNINGVLDNQSNAQANVLGGTVNLFTTWNNGGNLNLQAPGQVVMPSGALSVGATRDMAISGANAFDWSGGHFTGGGMLVTLGGQTYDGTATGDFSRPFSVSDNASVVLGASNSGGGPEFDMAGGIIISGDITQSGANEVHSASVAVNAGAVPADGHYRQNASTLTVDGNVQLNGGDFTVEAVAVTSIAAFFNANATGGTPNTEIRGAVTAQKLEYNGGTVDVDGTGGAGQLVLQGTMALAVQLSNTDLDVTSGGSFLNSTGYIHTGGSFDVTNSTARLSFGAGNDATFNNVDGEVVDGGISVADDLFLNDGTDMTIRDTVASPLAITLTDSIVVSGATAPSAVTLSLRAGTPFTWNGGLWLRGDATGTLDGSAGAYTYGVNTADVTTGGHFCQTQACSLVLDATVPGSPRLNVTDSVTVNADDAIYVSGGTADIADVAIVNVLGTTGLDSVFVDDTYGAGTLDIGGELHANLLASNGTVTVAQTGDPSVLDIYDTAQFLAGTLLFDQGADVDVGANMYVRTGVTAATTRGIVDVGGDLFIEGAVVSHPQGDITIAGLLDVSGPSGADLGRLSSQQGQVSFARFDIGANGTWQLTNGADGVTTNTTDALGNRLDGWVQTDGTLAVDGTSTLDCVNGAIDGDGYSPSGCNLYIEGLFSNQGAVYAHRQLAVRGQLDNDGVIQVSRNDNGIVSSVGCTAGELPNCVGPGAAVMYNGGDLLIGNDFLVAGAYESTAGTLDVGCHGFGPCVPGNDDATDNGSVWVESTGQFHLRSGATVTTATGTAARSSCPDSSAFISAGLTTIWEGTATVNGDLCVSGTGSFTAAGVGTSRANVLGVDGGTDDGDLIVRNGGRVSVLGDGIIAANDLDGSGGSLITMLTAGPQVPIDFDGDGSGPLLTQLPLLQLDRDTPGNTDNDLTIGSITQSAGTIWADRTVALTGTVGSSITGDALLSAGRLDVEASIPFMAVDDDAQVVMRSGPHGFGDNTLGGRVDFTGATRFETNQDVIVEAGAPVTFSGATFDVDDVAELVLLAIEGTASLALADTAIANVDGYLHVAKGTVAPSSTGQLSLTDTASLTVTTNDDESYFLGGRVLMADNSQLTVPSFLLMTDQQAPAIIQLENDAVLTADTGLDPIPANWGCDATGVGADGVGIDFAGQDQQCTSLHGNARIDLYDDAQFVTDNRVIIHSDDTFDANPANRLGVHLHDDATMIQTHYIGAVLSHGVEVRGDAVLVVEDNATLDAAAVHPNTEGDNSGWHGALVLAGTATLNTNHLDLDGGSRMLVYGTPSINVGYDADWHGTFGYDDMQVPAGAWIISPSDGLFGTAAAGLGTPAPACGAGGGGGAADGGRGQDSGGNPSGFGGDCATCATFTEVAGNTVFASPAAGSSGGTGTGGPASRGGYGSGGVSVTGAANTSIRLNGNVIANGEDAADQPCPGGGGSGGGIYLEFDTVDLGSSLLMEANGGDGGASGLAEGGGGAGGHIVVLYRDSLIGTGDFRRVYALGGDGANPGESGTAALVNYNPTAPRIEGITSTYLYLQSNAGSDFTFHGPWNALDPINSPRGSVSNGADILLTVNGDVSLDGTDWLLPSSDVDVVMGGSSGWTMSDSRVLERPGETASFSITSSGVNLLDDESLIAATTVDIIGASGDWVIQGGSIGTMSSMSATNLNITGINNLTLGPWASLTGNVTILADVSVVFDRDGELATSVYVSADGISSGGAGVGGQSAGGGYGGRGGDGAGGGGPTYGNAILPAQVGSAGGLGPNPTDLGGLGGGSIDINAPTCTLDGQITASGVAGTALGGGGSGGRIVLNCSNLSFPNPSESVLTAAGGSGPAGTGGGGGGNVSVIAATPQTMQCDVSGGVGGQGTGEKGNCSQRVGVTVPYDLYVYDRFRMFETDRPSLGAPAAPAPAVLNDLIVTDDTVLTGNFADTGTGAINMAGDFTLGEDASWHPQGVTALEVTGTLDWQRNSFVGDAGDLPDMSLALGAFAYFRNDAELGDVTITSIPALQPIVEFGQELSATTGPFAARTVDVQLVDGSPVGSLTLHTPYTVTVSGRGNVGGVAGSLDGLGAGGGTGGNNAGGGGGGSGGMGGDGQTAGAPAAGGLYDGSSRSPTAFGGGGGAGFTGGPTGLGVGGHGGGRVRFTAGGVSVLSTVTADGAAGSVSADSSAGGGGGGGGQIVVEGNVVTIGNDTQLFARGGAGGNATLDGGHGGGGRVVVTLHSGNPAAAETLADAMLGIQFSVDPGGAGANPGTMGVVRTLGDALPANDQVYAAVGWRHDDGGSVLLDLFDATRTVVLNDVATPVTINANQVLLDGTVWNKVQDLSLLTTQMQLEDTAVTITGGTLALDVGSDITVLNSSLAVTDVTIEGNTNNWSIDTSTLTAENLIQLAGITDLGVLDSTLTGNVVANLDGDLTVDATSVLDANGLGFLAQFGPGAGTSGTIADASGGGGGNGGVGGQGTPGGVQGAAGGAPVGSSLQPTLTLGSGGGNGSDAGASGGRGGGFHNWNVAGTFTLDGVMRANGAESLDGGGNTSGGGGAGGNIFVTTNIAAVTGVVEARGGDAAAATYQGGGGAGGRILVQAAGFIPLPEKLDVRAGSGGAAPAAQAQPGTAGVVDISQNELTVVGGWRFEPTDLGQYPSFLSMDAIPSAIAGVGTGSILQADQDITVSLNGPYTINAEMQQFTGGNNFTLTAASVTLNDDPPNDPAAILTSGGHLNIAGTSAVTLNGNGFVDLRDAAGAAAGTANIVGAGDLFLNDSSAVHGNLVFRGRDFTSQPGSVVDASFFGHAGGTGAGVPAPTLTGAGGGGGGYGGTGGLGADGVGTPVGSPGLAYGDLEAPTDLGSGGGLAATGGSPLAGTGGSGGGLVRIITTRDANVAGVIDNNGQDGIDILGACGGGGSGGSVFVSSGGSLNVPATAITARGGVGTNCATLDGGGGAGGRVALCSVSGVVDDSNVQVSGGTVAGSGTAGQPGTVVTNCAPVTPTTAVLVATNGVHLGDIDAPTGATEFPIIAFSITELTESDGAVMQGIVFNASGTVDETDIAAFDLVIDANGNGVRDAGDSVVDGGATFSSDDGSLAFDLTSLPTIAAGDSVDLLVTATWVALPATRDIVLSIDVNTDISLVGEGSGAEGLASGAPVNSGAKTITAAPLPAVSSFDPGEGSNQLSIPIEVYGVNFTGATDVRFDSVPPNTFVNLVFNTDSHLSAEITPQIPASQPGFYNVQVTTPFGTNATSAMLFRLFEPCTVPGAEGLCALGEQTGQTCEQVTFPGDYDEVCGNDIDEDCDGVAQDCNDDDDDDDDYSPNQGDCDDDDPDNNPDHSSGTPSAGMVCIIDDEHIPTDALAGTPRNLGTYVMAFDSSPAAWRTNNAADWYASSADSLLGSGFVLEGTDETVVVPYAPSLIPGPKLSVMGWFRADEATSEVVVVAAGDLAPAAPTYALYYSGGAFKFGLGTADGQFHEQSLTAQLVPDHWYHLAGTYDSDVGRMRFYIDGTLIADEFLSPEQVRTGAIVPLHIGSHPDLSPISTFGMIDEVRVFARVLDDTEVDTEQSQLRSRQPSTLGTAQQRLHLNFNAGFNDVSGSQLVGVPQNNERISGRSHQAEFPSVAYVVATDGGVDIYQPIAQGVHELFMRIPVGDNPGEGALQSNAIDFAEMLNGVLAVGDDEGLTIFDFVNDEIVRYQTGGRYIYSDGFGDLLNGTYALDTGDGRSLFVNPITGLAIGSDGADVIVAVGHLGGMTVLEVADGGDSATHTFLANQTVAALTFGEPGDDALYYGISPVGGTGEYRVIVDASDWIGAGGSATGSVAIDLPAVSAINDADFALANSAPGEWRLMVAHDAGLTFGVLNGDVVDSGDEVLHTDGTLLCPTDNVRSAHYDFDSRYTACNGAGVTSWDDGAELIAEYIDDTVETNDIGQLTSLDIVGVGGHTEICVATPAGLDCFFRPLSQGSCDTGLDGVCGVDGGTQFPLSGPPLTDNICVQDVFPTQEDCGGDDLDCDGDANPAAPGLPMCGPDPCICLTGVPWVDLGPAITRDIADCTPVTIDLPQPTVIDDTDPAPRITLATSVSQATATIDGNLSEWVAGNQLGAATGVTYHFESDLENLYFAAIGPDYDATSLGFRAILSEAVGAAGCTVVLDSGANVVHPDLKANFLIEVTDAGDLGVRKCTDPATDLWGALTPGALTVQVTGTGLELAVDTTHSIFNGSDVEVPTDTDFVILWSYDAAAAGLVAQTFPANAEGTTIPAPNQPFTTFHPLEREVPLNNTFPLGVHSYQATATDFDGNTGFDSIAVTVNKTSNPFLETLSDLTVGSTAALTLVEWRCQEPGAPDARLADCGDGGVSYWDDIDVAPPAHAQNCAGGLVVSTTGVPPGNTYPVGVTPITVRVTDAQGLWTEQAINVTVVDTTPPDVAWHTPPVEDVLGEPFYYLDAGDPALVEVAFNGLYDVTDNADPPSGTLAVCTNDMPPGGADPLPGQEVVVTLECEDPSGNIAIETLHVVRTLATPIQIEFAISQILPGPTEVPVDGPDLDNDPDNWFGTHPTLKVTVVEVTGPGESCDVGLPVAALVGADGVVDDSTPGEYIFTQTTEGTSFVMVSGQSLCDPDSLTTTDYDIAIDTEVPTFDAGFNAAVGTPATVADEYDISLYEGAYALQAEPHFTLAGTLGDTGCGIESVTAEIFQVGVDTGSGEFARNVGGGDVLVATLINQAYPLNPSLNSPDVGQVSVINPSTTGLWGDGASGLNIPAAADAAGYELRMTVTDCAGHSAQRTWQFFALTLDTAIGRMLAATERYLVSLQALSTFVVAVEPGLLEAERALLHARAALRQTDGSFASQLDHPLFGTTSHGIRAGVDELSVVLGALGAERGDGDPDHIEIRRKTHELAQGAGLWNLNWYDELDSNGWLPASESADEVGPNLLDASANLDEAQIDNSPATAALIATRWATYYTELGRTGSWQGVLDAIQSNPGNPSFFAALGLLTDLRNRVDTYLVAAHAEGDILGLAAMTDIQTKLDHIDLVFYCYASGGVSDGDHTCAGFGGGSPVSPSSRDLADNVIDLLTIQQDYEVVRRDHYVDTDSQAFLNGVVASIAFANGITNSQGNLCGEETHPLIGEARATRADIETLRDDISPGGTTFSGFAGQWSAEDVLCIAAYTYNAAYVLDTAYPAVNLEGEELEVIDRTSMGGALAFCFPDDPSHDCHLASPVNCSLSGPRRTLYLQQDIYDDVRCPCSLDYFSRNIFWCNDNGVTTPFETP